MADSGTSGFVIGFLVIMFIWLAVITALLVAAWLGKITVAPTGPTGPRGETGPSSVAAVQSVLPFTMPSGLTTMTSTNTSPNNTSPNNTSPINTSPTYNCNNGNINGVNNGGNNGIDNINGVASCDQCQFYSNGNINNTQIIPPSNPYIVRWVLSTNSITTNYNNGVFILPPGTYSLSGTSINYLSSLKGGTYRTMAAWLHSSTTNSVDDTELIGVTSSLSISNIETVLTFPSTLQFTVSGNRNIFSIITWHDSPHNLAIGGSSGTTFNNNRSRFNLIKIA